ncbi:MAG: beta-lactamase family protein, partial [Gemmatimonadota bacterium]|nr:beta-lactamase family protein [Gemmatimonadota bacterium]
MGIRIAAGRIVLFSALSLSATCGNPEAGNDQPAVATPPAGVPVEDSLAGWYALGIGAHHMCAGLWVVGRDLIRTPDEVVEQDIARFDVFRWGSDFSWTVDEGGHTASVSSPRFGTRTAAYNGDQGCTLLPAGAERVYFDPRPVPRGVGPGSETAWPTGDVDRTAQFAEVDELELEEAFNFAFDESGPHGEQNTRGLAVVYRGKIIGERYLDGWGPNTPQISWSMGKSIASALTGVLVQQGAFALDDPAPVPEWNEVPGDPRANVRVRDLLRMSSGLDFDNFGLGPRSSYTAANEHMRIYFDALNVFRHALNQPLRYEPGAVWRYRNSDPLTLMTLAKEVTEERGEDFLTF